MHKKRVVCFLWDVCGLVPELAWHCPSRPVGIAVDGRVERSMKPRNQKWLKLWLKYIDMVEGPRPVHCLRGSSPQESLPQNPVLNREANVDESAFPSSTKVFE